jgi:5-formyltetrahydrofolate cyclo-ligase
MFLQESGEVIRLDKMLLRQEMHNKRKMLTQTEIQDKSQKIAQRLFSLPHYHKASYIFIYLALKNEVPTGIIIENAWLQKKKILVPVCQKRDNSLLLSELHSFSELGTGTWNIPEPPLEYLRPVPPSIADLTVIPGLAFDPRGYRLGYGAGYYDRFLPQLSPECPVIALAYDFQVLDNVPSEPHDIPVDMIITEKKTYIPNK